MYQDIIKEGLALAKEAALAAGKVHLQGWRSGLEITDKDSEVDIVTDADLESEKVILKTLQSSFPQHNYLTEETPTAKTTSPYLWVIDPIDGTTNYSKGLPYFSVSIALYHQNDGLLGVVYNPATGELFWGARGQGARLGEEPIHCSTVDRLQKSLLLTGFYYDRGEGMKGTLDRIERFFRQGIMGIRRFGSAALDLCYLACGRVDGFWEHELSPWDFSGGAIIAREAGCKTSNLTGGPLGPQKSYVVASTPGIYEDFLKILQKK
jgi:myo-inositol-1(or 4)-monophosphatase